MVREQNFYGFSPLKFVHNSFMAYPMTGNVARQVPAVLVASERVAVGAQGPAHGGGGSWETSPPSFPSSVSVCS